MSESLGILAWMGASGLVPGLAGTAGIQLLGYLTGRPYVDVDTPGGEAHVPAAHGGVPDRLRDPARSKDDQGPITAAMLVAASLAQVWSSIASPGTPEAM